MSTSQLPWPSAALLPAGWTGVQRLLARCAERAAAGALPATLLVTSPAGLGREALAVELAAALVCRDGGSPGCRCAACERVRRGVHPDVEVVGVLPGNAQIKIEQARAVVETIAQLPYEGRRRVVVVDSCHTPPLGADAAAALLKTLEEPPAHAVFLLLAANPRRVLPTIASRAVGLRVPPPDLAELVALVAAVHRCDATRAEAIVAAAGGDVELAREGGDELPERVQTMAELEAAALAGDGLAIVRAAALASGDGGVDLAVTTLIRLAAEAGAERAEWFLEAAASLLAANARRAVLHLDLKATLAGALAQAAARG